MTQIYKVAHLKNNEIETLYVFYGSKIEGVEYDSEKLKERFESDKNDILFKDIFAENLLDEIINKDIKVVFVDMKIHLDDTIENIKTKMLYATGGNTFSFVEMYLFVKRSIQHYPEKIYENLTQNGSFDLLRLHMEQFLHNINRPELMDTIGIKETYDYDDIINLKLTDEKYTTNKSIDQKIVVKDTNYPYFVNPYDITEVGRLLDDSQENMTTTTNNHILMNFGEFENDIIYMCTTEDVIDYTNAKNLSEESCIKIYYPKLYDKNITSIKILETNKESLLFASKNMISDRFKVIEYNINLMNDVHTSKGSVMTKYNKKGVTSLDFIIHPFTPFNLPLDVVFKLINTTEDVALTKYNPGKSQEKMYRLHTAYTATNGKKIPTLSKQEIFKNMKEIGKSKSVSVHVKYEYNGEYRTLICQFISNGDINIKIDGFIEVVDIDTTIKGPINNIIDKVRGYISQGGYNMNNFNSIDDTNIEVNNIDYRLELPVNRRLDVESLNKCISGVFIVSNFNISKGIEMRYKRVDNYTEMLAEEALIIDLHNKGLNHDIVIENLISNNEINLDFKNDFYIDPNLDVKTIKTIANSDYRIELKSFDQEKRSGAKVLKNPEGNINGIEMRNSTIPRLYQTLFDVASNHRVVYKDSLSENDFPYENANRYNMTIEVSDDYLSKWRKTGINFLNENFDVNAKMGVDNLDCYVLKNIDNIIKESNSDKTEYMFMGSILKSKKIKMSQLAEYLENFAGLPVLDKTSLNGEYDIELEWQEVDFQTLHSELKKYGLKFEKSEKKLPVEIMEVYKKK